jgi:transposase
MMRHEQGLEHRQRAGRPGPAEPVYAGIDTHADTHHVAVIDAHGRAVDDVRVEATAGGYRRVLRFLSRWAGVVLVGVECTGSYGAGITRVLTEAGYDVREVNRPNRFDRRARGKTDVFDAYSAAEAVLSGRATAVPKGGDGLVEALRALRTTRSSALREHRDDQPDQGHAGRRPGESAGPVPGTVEQQADHRAGVHAPTGTTGDR